MTNMLFSDHYEPVNRDVNIYNGAPEFQFNGPVDFLPRYKALISEEESSLSFYDPIWGEHEIKERPGDDLLLEIFQNPLVQRSMYIEQLTLGPEYSTLPNTGYFSRWEHIWGSLAFVRSMIDSSPELQELSDRDKLILQLRTFVSDLGHTAYSHLGDWITQGFGGAEDAHDQELMHILEVSGINDSLRQYDIDPEEVVFPDIEDWIERSSPDLCVDRVDYAVREINRWLSLSLDSKMLASPDAFKIIDGQIVVANKQLAITLTKAYSLLTTEHWGAPIHRLQLALLQEIVKHAILEGEIGDVSMSPENMNPRDALYTVDRDFNIHMESPDKFAWTVAPIMQSIGREQRRIFAQLRESLLRSFLSTHIHEQQANQNLSEGEEPRYMDWDYPEPGKTQDVHGAYPYMPQQNTRVEIIPVDSQDEIEDFGQNPYTVDVFLPALKPRMIDPLFIDEDGEVKRLSDEEPRMAKLHEDQAKVAGQAYVARMLVTPEYKEIIDEGMADNEQRWADAMERPRLDRDGFGHIIRESARLSVGRLVEVNWIYL